MTVASKLQVQALRTRILGVGEDLAAFIQEHIPVISEGTILAVTSKIVSLAEKAIVAKASIGKEALVRREADQVLGQAGYGVFLTIKDGLVIPSAGIDESNAEGDFYILYPTNPLQSARRLYEVLKSHYRVENFGVLLTDSHALPLRKGMSGVGLAAYGFAPVKELVGREDLFGRKLVMTSVNVLDSLAAAAVWVMGEAAESCPLALLQSDNIRFDAAVGSEGIAMDPKLDLYSVLIAND